MNKGQLQKVAKIIIFEFILSTLNKRIQRNKKIGWTKAGKIYTLK